MNEPLRMLVVGCEHHPVPVSENLIRDATMHLRRCEIGQCAVAMLVVVPREERAAVRQSIFDAASVSETSLVLRALRCARSRSMISPA